MILDPSYILSGLKSLSGLISLTMISLLVSNITCFLHCHDTLHNIIHDEDREPTEEELQKIKNIHNKNRIRIYQVSIGCPLVFYIIRTILIIFTKYNLDIPDMFILVSVVMPIILTYLSTNDGSSVYEEDIKKLENASSGIFSTLKDIIMEVIKKK